MQIIEGTRSTWQLEWQINPVVAGQEREVSMDNEGHKPPYSTSEFLHDPSE